MRAKLESLKDKSIYAVSDFIRDNNIDTWEYTYCKHNISYDKLLVIDSENNVIKNAYLDSKELNTLPAFYFYFPLGTKLDDLLMDSFCIGIKSGSVEAALWCLGTLYTLNFKKIYVTNTKPAKLRPYRLIHSSYREQAYLNWKSERNLKKVINKIKIIKEPML
jgi:hypothetical protein